jgi:hypothetical protein
MTVWHPKRLHIDRIFKLYSIVHAVEIDRGRREEEDEWLDMLRGYWARMRTETKVLYYFTEEFDAMMCKMWFQ